MHAIREITTAVSNLGGTIPTQIRTVLANWDAACDAANDIQPALDQLAQDVCGAANPRTIAKLIETAATRAVIGERARDMVNAIEGAAAHQIVLALRGDAGTELIQSLRPVFDRAARAISSCEFSPDTSTQPNNIIALGDKAVAAWRELPSHAAVLNRIHRDVVVSLVHQLDLLPEPVEAGPGARFAALIIDGDGNTNIAQAASVFHGTAGTGEPGGGWHRLVNSGFKLKLNTPAEAVEIINQWNAGIEAERQRQRDKAAEVSARLSKMAAVSR